MNKTFQENFPRLIHLGTQKAASTYLYNLLACHPKITLPKTTEINFFSVHYDKGIDWYLGCFPQGENKIDTSPKYFMQGEKVAPRIEEYAKSHLTEPPLFLLILRNPIDYLNSHFLMQQSQGFFKDNPDYPVPENSLADFIKRYPDYLKRAQYARILKKHWLANFPLEQFEIVVFEEFIQNEQEVIKKILAFWQLLPVRLKASKISKNQRLRYDWLTFLRKRVSQRQQLKDFLKSNQAFNYFYDNFLTRQPTASLSNQDRNYLKDALKDDVRELKSLVNKNIKFWQDFI